MTWLNISSCALEKHNISITYSKIPLLVALHLLYGLIVAVSTTAQTLPFFIFGYFLCWFLFHITYQYHLFLKLYVFCHLKSQWLYPSLINQAFVISATGELTQVLVGSLKKEDAGMRKHQVLADSLIYWWGVLFLVQDKQTNHKVAWFVFKDSVSDDDYRRLTRIVKQIQQANVV
ncbi:protein YgfX [Thalassotalea eurytherma]|uniref:Uncharacterized protein n=1 Tax=Thalassotalea eurytherma TaxID=1144278 RepID=A0ABQ6H3H4_9GAMM|nr:protein YgfX [Thalassotalea eurytherma]GLX81421.1 hypothetical protein theurythT_08730 [Thalassotalea eurytherma]